MWGFLVEGVDDGDEKGCGFSGSVFGSGDDGFLIEDARNDFFLDGRGSVEVFGDDSFDEVFL